MSKKPAKTSAEAQEKQRSDSVYDFLYYDRQRVGSFLAQFNDAGHLQRITESRSASKGTRRGFKVGATGSVMGTGGGLNFERSPGEHASEGIERVYDPLWTNALEFLDCLEEGDLVQRNVPSARIGQFVIASGALSVTDLPLLRKIWEAPAMKTALVTQFQAVVAAQLAAAQQAAAAAQSQPPASAQAPPVAPPPPQVPLQIQAALAPLMMEVLSLMPSFLLATIDGTGYSIWCGLVDEWLVGTSADIALKHGYEIAGQWAILGIVDALPGSLPTLISIPPVPFGAEQNQGPHARNFAVAARRTFGRPADAFGVTPLLIFREVSSGTTGI